MNSILPSLTSPTIFFLPFYFLFFIFLNPVWGGKSIKHFMLHVSKATKATLSVLFCGAKLAA